MSNFLEVTGNDIAELNDADLRELVGLLCEADYRSAGLPTKGIIWGGNQDAKDGGLDVVVRDATSPPSTSYVPRSVTGFQVKKPDMPRTKILNEMRPKDVLQESIKELIRHSGAYVIVSSTGSTTDSALANRLKAMQEAVVNDDKHKQLHLDFYDRGRVATWVRSYPSLVLWVRNKIAKPFEGWHPYDNWASAPGGVEEEYLLDDGLRLHDGARPTDEGFSAEAGFSILRSALSVPGTSVRLAGLSGVGKTRFAQALFDERIGTDALETFRAIYTDMSEGTVPDPKTLANQLINDKVRAILIVDNCTPDLHHRLTRTCSSNDSTVSLLTIEYDVRDDLPESTSVYRLEPASEEIIERLIKIRFTHISEVDARTIANFSGGNARVAIALANTMQQGETVSGFRNEELFERLFYQRHSANQSLLASAQVFSLVYSFEGTDADSDESELKFLASLVRKSGAELFRDVAELKSRDLIQSRSVWRALLPHAIANRLAVGALKTIPKMTIVDGFLHRSERLIKSFTRRLNYLHDCDEAVEIVNDWLEPDGWVGKEIGNLNGFGITVLQNIAPVSPQNTLDAIERIANSEEGESFTSGENRHHREFVRLLRNLAYDPELFERSVDLLSRFALLEAHDKRENSIRNVLRSLFYIYLSGTHAPFEVRAKVINHLVNSDDQNELDLGMYLLDAALETWHFSSSHEFDFGARPRDYGYRPNTKEEIKSWFNQALDICVRLALSEKSISSDARKLLADNLRSLWSKGGVHNELVDRIREIHEQQAWNDGWIAVRQIIRFDVKRLGQEARENLFEMEKLLKPNDLLEKARTFALSKRHGVFDLSDAFEVEDPLGGYEQAEEATRNIGAEVAQDAETLDVLLSDMVSSRNRRLFSFGLGLAEGCSDRRELFHTLYDALQKVTPEERNIDVILGFLSSCSDSDPEFYNETLDRLVDDDVLGEFFPLLQTTSVIDLRGIERLHQALDIGKAKIDSFKCLAWGRAHEPLEDDNFANLLKQILDKEGGIEIALEILNMRFHGKKEETLLCSDILKEVARSALSSHIAGELDREQRQDDYELANIASICLIGHDAQNATKEILHNVVEAINKNRIYATDYPLLLSSFAQAQPRAFLDSFLAEGDLKDYQRRRLFSDYFGRRENPMSQIPDDDLIAWCEEDPSSRYSVASSTIEAFKKSSETGNYAWNSIVYKIFDKTPDVNAVARHLAESLRQPSLSGSSADILQERAVLFQEFYDHDNDEVAAWAKNESYVLQEQIDKVREWEDQENREIRGRNESFE